MVLLLIGLFTAFGKRIWEYNQGVMLYLQARLEARDAEAKQERADNALALEKREATYAQAIEKREAAFLAALAQRDIGQIRLADSVDDLVRVMNKESSSKNRNRRREDGPGGNP